MVPKFLLEFAMNIESEEKEEYHNGSVECNEPVVAVIRKKEGI